NLKLTSLGASPRGEGSWSSDPSLHRGYSDSDQDVDASAHGEAALRYGFAPSSGPDCDAAAYFNLRMSSLHQSFLSSRNFAPTGSYRS
ncbi:unnamed protein product, partial [Symbiodinium pilosum]